MVAGCSVREFHTQNRSKYRQNDKMAQQNTMGSGKTESKSRAGLRNATQRSAAQQGTTQQEQEPRTKTRTESNRTQRGEATPPPPNPNPKDLHDNSTREERLNPSDLTMGSTTDDDNEEVPLSEQTRRPLDTAFRQQRVNAWYPVLDPWYVAGAFIALAAIFIPTGEFQVVPCVTSIRRGCQPSLSTRWCLCLPRERLVSTEWLC